MFFGLPLPIIMMVHCCGLTRTRLEARLFACCLYDVTLFLSKMLPSSLNDEWARILKLWELNRLNLKFDQRRPLLSAKNKSSLTSWVKSLSRNWIFCHNCDASLLFMDLTCLWLIGAWNNYCHFGVLRTILKSFLSAFLIIVPFTVYDKNELWFLNHRGMVKSQELPV